MWKSRSDAYHKIIFVDNMTIIECIDFGFALILSRYKATCGTHYISICFFLKFIANE